VGGARCLGRACPPQFDPLGVEIVEEPDAAAEEYGDEVEMEREARLLGLDAPVAVTITDDQRERVMNLVERLHLQSEQRDQEIADLDRLMDD
jgi:hypothetical protein